MASNATSSKTPSKLKLAIEQHKDSDFNKDTQAILNNPVSTEMSPEDSAFLKDVVDKIEKKAVDLYTPSSLLNKEIYQKLEGSKSANVDLILHNLLASLRLIHSWHTSGGTDSNFQMIQLVHEVRLKKEALEKEVGDVLKI